jgi:hypothetical protein
LIRDRAKKGGVMRTPDKKKTLTVMAFLALGVVLVAFTASCTKAKEPNREAVEMSTLIPIFGESKETTSGVVDVEQTPEELDIFYHFNPGELTEFDEAIGEDLTPKIRELYKKVGYIDRVVFDVSVPARTADTGWEHYVSFAVTRKLIEQTDWTELPDKSLLRVALEVQYAE